QTTVSLSGNNLRFGKEIVGSVSRPLDVVLTNSGGSDLNITSIVTSANFAQTNNCGNLLPPRKGCKISVTFAPTTIGQLTGTLTINDDAAGSPQTADLFGTGVAAEVTLTPSSLTFGPQKVGTTSEPQNVTLTNTGNAPLT